jgi:hypothetical protein
MDDVNLGDFDFSSDSSPLGDADDKAEKSVDTAAELESVNVESDKLESNDFDFDFDDTSVAEKSEVPDEDSLMVSDWAIISCISLFLSRFVNCRWSR